MKGFFVEKKALIFSAIFYFMFCFFSPAIGELQDPFKGIKMDFNETKKIYEINSELEKIIPKIQSICESTKDNFDIENFNMSTEVYLKVDSFCDCLKLYSFIDETSKKRSGLFILERRRRVLIGELGDCLKLTKMRIRMAPTELSSDFCLKIIECINDHLEILESLTFAKF